MTSNINSTPSNARTVDDGTCRRQSRREVFTALGATALAGIAAASVLKPETLNRQDGSASRDTALLALVDQLRASDAQYHELTAPYADTLDDPPAEVEADIESNVRATNVLRIELANIPAFTRAGRQAKAWALLDEWGLEKEGDQPWEGDTNYLLWSLARDVLSETV